jgi:glucan 1,3-beta-glucosidase
MVSNVALFFCLLSSTTYYAFTIDKIKGVNIGGWLVLEPWITPSLFYSFLGDQTIKNNNKIGMDMYTFCEILGPVKANNLLRTHWSSWINEKHIQTLVKNKINLLRVPIGDWMYIPYGPFSIVENNTKCADGSIEVLDQLFILATKYNVQILLDLHAIKDSQNGFDNSGQTMDVEIINNTFVHWPIRTAKWIGEFNQETKTYIYFNEENIQHSKMVLLHIINKYYSYPMLYGLCVLNEPWEFTPESFLKTFYQDIFDIFTEYMSNDKVFVIHDSFRSDIWQNFEFIRNEKEFTILIDTHQYTAWNGPYSSFENLLTSSNNWQSPNAKYKYIIGEWSLAIDNCEMWLNGFMDNLPNYPLFECTMETCFNYHKFNFELSQSVYGPFGLGISSPKKNDITQYFECPVSIPLHTHFYTEISENELAQQLFVAKSTAFEKFTAGWIYWNFRTESSSYQWDYLAYIKLIETNKYTILNKNNITNKNEIKNIYYKIFFICIFFIFLIVSIVINIHRYILNKKYKGYTVISSKQFETQNYQSI